MLSLSYIPVSVIYCCLTNYPSTQWFKTVRFLWVSNLASLSQVSLVSQRAAVKVLDPLPSSVVVSHMLLGSGLLTGRRPLCGTLTWWLASPKQGFQGRARDHADRSPSPFVTPPRSDILSLLP